MFRKLQMTPKDSLTETETLSKMSRSWDIERLTTYLPSPTHHHKLNWWLQDQLNRNWNSIIISLTLITKLWISISIAIKLFCFMLSSHVSLHIKAFEVTIGTKCCIFFSSNLSRWLLFSFCHPVFYCCNNHGPILHQWY